MRDLLLHMSRAVICHKQNKAVIVLPRILTTTVLLSKPIISCPRHQIHASETIDYSHIEGPIILFNIPFSV